MSEQIRVELDHGGTAVFVGTAYFHIARGHISTTFKYSDEYVGARWAYSVDPELPLSTVPFSAPGLPGAFADCSPDRWGRNLVAKEHRRQIADGFVRDRRLTDIDFLLGVSDRTRQGALRFRRAADEDFLSPSSRVPKLLALPELQRAADGAAEGSGTAVKRLLDAGQGLWEGRGPRHLWRTMRESCQLRSSPDLATIETSSRGRAWHSNSPAGPESTPLNLGC